jgi:hypothetical protein
VSRIESGISCVSDWSKLSSLFRGSAEVLGVATRLGVAMDSSISCRTVFVVWSNEGVVSSTSEGLCWNRRCMVCGGHLWSMVWSIPNSQSFGCQGTNRSNVRFFVCDNLS